MGIELLAQAQLRFRLVGTQPALLDRAIEPASSAAEQFIRGGGDPVGVVGPIARIVERAATRVDGHGPIALRGVALSSNEAGYAANTVQSMLDDSPEFAAMLAAAGDEMQRAATTEQLRAAVLGRGPTHANAAGGWVNLGPEASRVLDPTLPATTPIGLEDAALAVRVLTHEAAHIVDDSRPALGHKASWGMREGIADLRSRDIELLRHARGELGMPIRDADLEHVIDAFRPYRSLEGGVAFVADAAGMPLASVEGQRLLRMPIEAFAEQVVDGIATRHSLDPELVRSRLDEQLATASRTFRQ